MSKVTVLGGGGWAIALAKVLNENGHNVTLWSALEREVEALTKERENKVGLPGVKIPEEIKITNDIKEAVKDSKMIVMAVASSFVRSTSELLKDIGRHTHYGSGEKGQRSDVQRHTLPGICVRQPFDNESCPLILFRGWHQRGQCLL